MKIHFSATSFTLFFQVIKWANVHSKKSLIIILCLGAYLLPAQDRPNIVWIVTEDNSKHYLKLYNEKGASMPTIERLAKKGKNICRSQSNPQYHCAA